MLPSEQTPKAACAEAHDREAGPDPSGALTQALKRLEELCAYGRYYLQLRVDEAHTAWRGACRRAFIKLLVGLALTLFCVEMSVVILNAMSAGIAQSTQWPTWLVQIASGLAGLLIVLGGAVVVLRTQRSAGMVERRKDYEKVHGEQRARWGRDVEQAAQERTRHYQAREELGGNGHPAGRLRTGANPWQDRRSTTMD